MFLFHFLNGCAGSWPWLDSLARLYYVGAVPLLATALAALLCFVPRDETAPARWRIAAGAALAVLACIVLMALINAFAAGVLGTDNLSPRPYMTRFATLIVVEPNDNSFPAPELMIAGALATALLATSPMGGSFGWGAVLLLGITRLFCGTNYPADVFVGAFLGGGLGALALALFRVRLQLPAQGGKKLVWRARHQAVLSGGGVFGVLLIALYAFWLTPRYQSSLRLPWSTPATASPSSEAKHETMMGEGAPSDTSVPTSHVLLDSPVMRLDGHLPRAEKLLWEALGKLGLSHSIVGVNVAAIKAGTSGYRVAAVRFEVKDRGTEERRRVAVTASRIVRGCFHADGQLRNVDVLGVVSEKDDDGAKRETVVFSAAVRDRDMKLATGPAWLNWAKVDPGLWLRARSELYFDPEVLPAK